MGQLSSTELTMFTNSQNATYLSCHETCHTIARHIVCHQHFWALARHKKLKVGHGQCSPRLEPLCRGLYSRLVGLMRSKNLYGLQLRMKLKNAIWTCITSQTNSAVWQLRYVRSRKVVGHTLHIVQY